MNNKKRVLVMLLAIVTMLMVVGNVAFATHIVDRWTDCDRDGDNCIDYVRKCTDINDPDSCWVEKE
ncbi:hypothetical protein [Dethiothermospora halolimnae]|uniref:hypothetical protein n=1 Tax=Dethiothermospora halolimnae TaxID=3114390 RepID=UPI003CCBA92D